MWNSQDPRQVCRSIVVSLLVELFFLLPATVPMLGQSPATAPAIVPHLVKFGGTLLDEAGKPRGGVVGITFALYKEEQGGAPLWLETQNVQLDDNGHYSVDLGATKSEGVPPALFISGEAHWLGVQVEGQAEQPRVLLVSAPYALKAADAETVGGLPPSAFVLASPSGNASSSVSSAAAPSANAGTPAAPPAGTLDFIPLFTDNEGTLGNSVLFQTGSGATAKVGLNTTTPSTTLDVKGTGTIRGSLTLPAVGTATATAGKNSQPVNQVAS